MSATPGSADRRPRRRWLALLPLLVFLGLAAVFLAQLMSGRELTAVPSALIGQPAPQTHLPPLPGGEGLPGLSSADRRRRSRGTSPSRPT